MPTASIWNFIRARRRHENEHSKFLVRLLEVVNETWYLGVTAFGGPPVHFQIFHKKFVEHKEGRDPWLDEQTYQELFAICQALPGPGSTKFLFATVLLRSGWACAIIAFLFWSLPGALSMFGLALGVRRISDTLPDPVYALLSGLNASTVGIVAVAAVQLAEKRITDSLSRGLVIFGACAGLCYSALWYFPVLMVTGGLVDVVWDLWLGRRVRMLLQAREDRKRRAADRAAVLETEVDSTDVARLQTDRRHEQESVYMPQISNRSDHVSDEVNLTNRKQGASSISTSQPVTQSTTQLPQSSAVSPAEETARNVFEVPLLTGAVMLAAFVVSFIAVLVARSEVKAKQRSFSLFANMYLAGTIIFGGGPVVIPLLREYVVAPGWVDSRDFLIGLAIIQALPGPNFNFSVYLGALALSGLSSQHPTAMALLGAVIAFIGIFTPGLVLTVAFQGFWRKLRTKPIFLALLRGINASAIGLVFTAVYRLWEVGYLTKTSASSNRGAGRSLADEPWWVVVAVVTFAGNRWFNVAAPIGIMIGGLLGLCWWAATQR